MNHRTNVKTVNQLRYGGELGFIEADTAITMRLGNSPPILLTETQARRLPRTFDFHPIVHNALFYPEIDRHQEPTGAFYLGFRPDPQSATAYRWVRITPYQVQALDLEPQLCCAPTDREPCSRIATRNAGYCEVCS